jgi:hypothetical protein
LSLSQNWCLWFKAIRGYVELANQVLLFHGVHRMKVINFHVEFVHLFFEIFFRFRFYSLFDLFAISSLLQMKKFQHIAQLFLQRINFLLLFVRFCFLREKAINNKLDFFGKFFFSKIKLFPFFLKRLFWVRSWRSWLRTYWRLNLFHLITHQLDKVSYLLCKFWLLGFWCNYFRVLFLNQF